MTADELRQLPVDQAAQLPRLLYALWQDAQGHWVAAHEVAQDVGTPDGAWVHAFLHRREGDTANAAYWYRRAGKPVVTGPLDVEWSEIASALMTAQP